MDPDELRDALRAVADDIEPPATFADSVLRGATRRQARRRITAIAGVFVVVLVAVTTALLLPGASGQTQSAADGRLPMATAGDRAGDAKFLNDALAVWRVDASHGGGRNRGMTLDWRPADLLGHPQVHWAGTTPAGTAVVVFQQAKVSGELAGSQVSGKTVTLIGLVGTDPVTKRLRVLGIDVSTTDRHPVEGGNFLFGAGDRTVLALDYGKPLYVSPGPLAPSVPGEPVRQWQKLQAKDGVAVAELPATTMRFDVRLINTEPDRLPPSIGPASGVLDLVYADAYLGQPGPPGEKYSHGLNWEGAVFSVGQPPALANDPVQTFQSALRTNASQRDGLFDPLSWSDDQTSWVAVAALPSGRIALVGEHQQLDAPAYVYAVVLNRDGMVDRVVRGDQITRGAAPAARVSLPDGDGWIVADRGSHLSYRLTPGGQFIAAGDDAALLPNNALQVMVSRPDGSNLVVGLG